MTEEQIIVETTFEVDIAPDQVWARMQRLTAEHDTGDGAWWLPGFECRATEVEAAPGRCLKVVKAEHPCRDTTIVFTLDHVASGSRIHVVQSGFDPTFVELAGEDLFKHGRDIYADLELFVRTGVIAERAWRPWAQFGFRHDVHSFGIEIVSVDEGGWAGRTGLAVGDILLTLAGVPVFDSEQISGLQRLLHVGEELDATWVRDGQRVAGTARLDPN